MQLLTVTTKRTRLLLAVLACVILAGAVSAMAATKPSVSRTIVQGETHTGRCCQDFDVTVSVYEPDRIAPIVVTFSTEYRATGPMLVALRLNNGPCVFSGPSQLATYNPTDHDFIYQSTTFQWVIMPGDYKLVKGLNTISVCGGAIFNDTDSIELGFNTLSARVERSGD